MYVLACVLMCLLLCTELLIAIVVNAFCYPGPTHMELGEVIRMVISDFFFKVIQNVMFYLRSVDVLQIITVVSRVILFLSVWDYFISECTAVLAMQCYLYLVNVLADEG